MLEQLTGKLPEPVELETTDESAEPKEITPEVQDKIDKLEASRTNLNNLKAAGDLTEESYNDAIEQVEHDIKKLKA